MASDYDLLEAELAEAKKDAERLHKLYWLAAQDVIFFATYDSKTKTWPDISSKFYCPCVCLNDTFAYASADGEELTDDQIDRLIDAYKRWGNHGVIAWASLLRHSAPLQKLETKEYLEARAAMAAQEKGVM